MLRYQKIDISEGTDINKTNASKECDYPITAVKMNAKSLLCV